MALIRISEIVSNTRYAKEIRFLGIPIYIRRELNLADKEKDEKKPIGFQQIGDVALLQTEDYAEEET